MYHTTTTTTIIPNIHMRVPLGRMLFMVTRHSSRRGCEVLLRLCIPPKCGTLNFPLYYSQISQPNAALSAALPAWPRLAWRRSRRRISRAPPAIRDCADSCGEVAKDAHDPSFQQSIDRKERISMLEGRGGLQPLPVGAARARPCRLVAKADGRLG